MKWVLRIVGGLALLMVALVAVGFILPSKFKVQRSVDIAAPADRIYGLVADPREWKR